VISNNTVALILKICLKKLQTFIHGGAQRQKCSSMVAPMQCQKPFLFIRHVVHSLLHVSKTGIILAKIRIKMDSE
jgi:hypothetical protein